jgi:hypothetical protein
MSLQYNSYQQFCYVTFNNTLRTLTTQTLVIGWLQTCLEECSTFLSSTYVRTKLSRIMQTNYAENRFVRAYAA